MGWCWLLFELFGYDRRLTMPAAVTAAAVSAPTTVKASTAANRTAADGFMGSAATEAAAYCAASCESTTVKATTTTVEPAPEAPSAEATAEPRAGTDEQPAGEVARTVVTIRRAGIRVIPVVSVSANRGWAHIARANADSHCKTLGISVRRQRQRGSKHCKEH